MMTSFLYRFGAAVLVILLVSCTSTPMETDYARGELPRTPGRYVDGAWFDVSKITRLGFTGVELSSVEPFRVSDVKNIAVAEALSWLREGLTEGQVTNQILAGDKSGAVAELEVALTELDPGSTRTRFWAGEFGAGHAWIQVEGIIKEANTGSIVGRLVQRTRISGVFGLHNSRFRDSGPVLVRQMLLKAGRAFRSEVVTALSIE